ncbi:MAG: type VI secretion system tube protein Hcp [Fibrobacterales bacterium]
MKRLTLISCACALTLLLLGCDQNNTAPAAQIFEQDNKETATALGAKVVGNTSNLPSCTSANRGEFYYIENEKTIKVCTATGYAVADISGNLEVSDLENAIPGKFSGKKIYMRAYGFVGSVEAPGWEGSTRIFNLDYTMGSVEDNEGSSLIKASKDVDKASHNLLSKYSTGEKIPWLFFYFFENEESTRIMYRVYLKNAIIKKIENNTNDGDEEAFYLDYEEMTWTYYDGYLSYRYQKNVKEDRPSHMFMTMDNIIGGVEIAGLEGSIALLDFDHTIGVDSESSSITKHKFITIKKEFDRASSYMHMYNSPQKNIPNIKIDFYDPQNHLVKLYEIELEDCQIVSVQNTSQPLENPSDAPFLETIKIKYTTITWNYLDGNFDHTDTWSVAR